MNSNQEAGKMVGKLTKTKLEALRWFSQREDASRFGLGDPSLRTIIGLCDAGLVCRCGAEAGTFGFTKFRITEAGRAALNSINQEGK